MCVCARATGRYRVSATAQELCALVHATLAEGVRAGSPALAQSSAAAVADAAELAGTLPPALRARELQAGPMGIPLC